MKINISKEWFMSRVDLEEGCSVEAGCPEPFELWFTEVIRVARLLGWKQPAIDSIDKDAWREYFNEGHTPAEAWEEEYDSAR